MEAKIELLEGTASRVGQEARIGAIPAKFAEMMQESAQEKIKILKQQKDKIIQAEESREIEDKRAAMAKLMSDKLAKTRESVSKILPMLPEPVSVETDENVAPTSPKKCQRCLKPYQYDIKYIGEDLAALDNEERTLGKGTQRFIAKVARWTRTSPSSLNSRWKRLKFAGALKARGLNLPLSVITPNRINACMHA